MTSRHFARGDDRGKDPEPGFYLVRMTRKGPRVPATISHENGLWTATVDGQPVGVGRQDHDEHEELMRIWHHGHRSTAAEHEYLGKLKAWAEQHEPEHPLLHPRRAVDVAVLPPVLP